MSHIITDIDYIGQKIVNACFQVHQELGAGLLESVYEECLSLEIESAGLTVARQKVLPVSYKGKQLDLGFRTDLFVEEKIILELKATDSLLPIHFAQVLTYLKLSQTKLGYLVNFNVPRIKTGIHRVIR